MLRTPSTCYDTGGFAFSKRVNMEVPFHLAVNTAPHQMSDLAVPDEVVYVLDSG